jgi:hypothetical protein
MLLEPRIRAIRAAGENPSPRGFQCVAKFDLEIGPDITLLGLRLVRTPSGGLQAYPPDIRDGTRSAAFAPAFRDQVAALAALSLEPSLVPIASPAA